jgi:putative ABC transport system substrate-binding protein
VTGVAMGLPPAAELDALLETAPDVRRIGVVLGRDSKRLLRLLRAAAARRGRTLVEIVVAAPSDLPARARGVVDQVDALWLPGDPAIHTREAFPFLLDLSLERRKPLLVFAEPLVRAGALVAPCPDYLRTGVRTADVVRRILSGERPGDIPVQRMDRTRVVVNPATARALGLEPPPHAIRETGGRP